MERKQRKFDWDAIGTEYITGDLSYRELADKHSVPVSCVCRMGAKRGWVAARKKHRKKVVAKAVQKTETKQARVLAKEMSLLNKIERHLDKALKDDLQFHRHLVSSGSPEAGMQTTEEIFAKADMRALRDAMAIAREAEKMRRSIMGVLTVSEREQIEIARKRLELDQRKQEQTEQTDTEVTIRFSDDEAEWSE